MEEEIARRSAADDISKQRAEAMLKDTDAYPFIGDVIDQLGIGRTTLYRYFPADRISKLSSAHGDGMQQ